MTDAAARQDEVDDRDDGEPYVLPPGWEQVSCGCCAGVEWGGLEPRECRDCRGNGWYFRHTPTGVLAMYPGGPFLGRERVPVTRPPSSEVT